VAGSPATRTGGTAAAPGLRWREIGRAAPEDEYWAVWVALDGCGSTFYRCLIAHRGAARVTIELHQPGATRPRRLHSGQRSLPADDEASARCIRELLEDADQAARTLLSPGGPQL